MITSTALGAGFERAARRVAPFLAITATLLMLVADTAYHLGRLLRLAIDDRARQLAALHRWALGLRAPAPAVTHASTLRVIEAPVPTPQPVMVAACRAVSQPAAVAPPDLATLTVAQLRSLARSRGHRGAKVRDARRSTLLVMLA